MLVRKLLKFQTQRLAEGLLICFVRAVRVRQQCARIAKVIHGHMTAVVLAALVGTYSIDPRLKVSFRVEALRLLQDADEDIVQQVLRQGIVMPQHAVHEVEQRLTVSAIDLVQGALLTFLSQGHQLLVAPRFVSFEKRQPIIG